MAPGRYHWPSVPVEEGPELQAMQGDWLPARAALHPSGLYLALREIRPAELQDPFMQETIARLPARESVVQVARADVGRGTAGTGPAGIVFHVARCGSTLVSQLLKQHVGTVVYAEPLPVNELLLPPHKWPRAEVVAALRSLGAAFANHARKPWVLKLSSWNTLFCELVAEAFPASPWALCLRDPLEVAVSLLRQPAGWMFEGEAPAAPFARLVDPGGAERKREEYVARVYGAFCEAALRLDPARGRLVDYAALPDAAWESVAPHFGLAVDEPARLRMRVAAGMDSKAPVHRPAKFSEDAQAKREAASPALRAAVDAHARPALGRLKSLHGGASA
ncbi:MAG TPA: hypothetical protein VFM30_02785 [Steroidobacteraceae bacterium]|nr:hypothetical protein [Steroidobacteraceae bacterium]